MPAPSNQCPILPDGLRQALYPTVALLSIPYGWPAQWCLPCCGLPLTLYRDRRSVAARIGRPYQDTALGVAHDQLHFPVINPRATPHHPMPHGFQATHRGV